MYEEYDSESNEDSYYEFIYLEYPDLDYYYIYHDDEENNFGLDYDLTYYYDDEDWALDHPAADIFTDLPGDVEWHARIFTSLASGGRAFSGHPL